MKKVVLFAFACALTLSMSSCDKVKNKLVNTLSGDSETSTDEVINEEYGSGYQSLEAEVEEYDGPSDVDMVDVDITETAHVTMLLDQFDYDINQLKELLEDKEGNLTEIQNLLDHIVRITEKMNEGAEAGHCTETQLARYQKQTEKFLAIVEANK